MDLFNSNNLNSGNVIKFINEDNIDVYLDVIKNIVNINLTTDPHKFIEYLYLGENSYSDEKIFFFQSIYKVMINKDGQKLLKSFTSLLERILPRLKTILESNKQKRLKNKMRTRNRVDLKNINKLLEKKPIEIIKILNRKNEKMKIIMHMLYPNEAIKRGNVRTNIQSKKLQKQSKQLYREQRRMNQQVNAALNIGVGNSEAGPAYNNEPYNLHQNILKEKILVFYNNLLGNNVENRIKTTFLNEKRRNLNTKTWEEIFDTIQQLEEVTRKNTKRSLNVELREQDERNIANVLKGLEL